MKLNQDVLQMIGNTPMVRVRTLAGSGDAEIWAKLEGFNPGGSVKDRIALAMIEAAEREGNLRPGGTLVEPTSGNTGIGLAMVAAVKGYRLVLTMPETMSMERRQLLQAYGAELVLTPGPKGMKGAVEAAEDLKQKNPAWFMPQQFENCWNPDVHMRTTAVEILNDLDGAPDGFVSGVGTGGTITGVGTVLRQKNPGVWIAAVEPAASPVLSGGKPGPHKIAGIGAGFVPGVLNTKIYDEVIQVSDADAAETARRMARDEGILPGISSGAAMWAALRIAKKLGRGRKVVVIIPDRGERYLSTGLFVAESP
ncbi:MAG: cysteine synthase A [Thermodesulfovibrionales bacterium]